MRGGGFHDGVSEAIRRSLCDHSAETQRFLEARRLLRDRVPAGHFYVAIPGDGNCMFAAFSQALKAVRGEDISPSQLRSMCVATIRDDARLSERFFRRRGAPRLLRSHVSGG